MENAGIKTHLDSNLDGNECMDDTSVTTLFRIVQESLTNIIKHANAKEVMVSIHLERDAIHLTIKDDGVGFNGNANPAARKNSFGLIGMQERALILNGCAKIESRPGHGTVVDVSIPVLIPLAHAVMKDQHDKNNKNYFG